MVLPLHQNLKFTLDDLELQKSFAKEKICRVCDFCEENKSDKLVKTASIDKNNLIELFAQMLKQLHLTLNSEDKEAVLEKMFTQAANKTASRNSLGESEQSSIKIASKSIKDSHYQIDISKDLIKHKGKQVFMVSCYARDAYLGRYLIKRNYFFSPDREASANQTYSEIHSKMSALKDRYYNEILDISGIFNQAKQILDGVISEVEFKEDNFNTGAK